MPYQLPMVDGYTIDERLGEFRKVEYVKGNPRIEFIPFHSKKGHKIMKKLRRVV
jgi:hypothetical protein